MAELKENCIEWLNGQDVVSVTLSQKRLISRVKKMAEKHPNLVTILAENEDGSIFAKLPLKSVKLSIISRDKSTFSDMPEQMEEEDESRDW